MSRGPAGRGRSAIATAAAIVSTAVIVARAAIATGTALGITAALALLGLTGCGGRSPAAVERRQEVELGVRFARGPGQETLAIPAGVDSMEFAAYAFEGAAERLLSSQAFRVTAATTEIVLDLRVPRATGYRLQGAALGIRDRAYYYSPAARAGSGGPGLTGGNPTLYGIQFYASQRLDAGLGPAARLDLDLYDVVPLGGSIYTPPGDSLSWSPVIDARSYTLRAYGPQGAPVETTLTDTQLFVARSRNFYYFRVRADIQTGVASAFSEIL